MVADAMEDFSHILVHNSVMEELGWQPDDELVMEVCRGMLLISKSEVEGEEKEDSDSR
jgi:hypothetical protein